MISGLSRMDSEWWKTPRFIYGKVLGSFKKFRVKPRKVRNLLEGGGTGPARPAPPRRVTPGLAGQAKPSGGGSLHASWRGRGVPPPHSFRCVLFPFIFGKLEFELVWTRDLVGLRNLRPHVSRAFIYETPGQPKTHNSTRSPGFPSLSPEPPAPAP